MPRLLKYLIVLTVLLAIVLPVVLLVEGLQAQPLVLASGTLTSGDVARAKALIKQYDPRSGNAGELRTLAVSDSDLTLMLGYALGRIGPVAAKVDLKSGAATISLTGQVPENPLGRYLNVGLDLAQVPGAVRVEGLRFGDLQVPGLLAEGIGWLVGQTLQGDETFQVVLASIDRYQVKKDQLVVMYQWQPGVLEQVKSRGKSLLISEADRERLSAYSARIAEVSRDGLFGGKILLTDVLGAVFQEADERTGTQGDAAAENRAAVLAMMLYIQGVNVPRLLDVPEDRHLLPEERTLMLQGRADFAQHFLVSAGVAAVGGSQLADAVGLFKEVDDSRGGSGFSFTDLAADRAGVRFAEAVTGADAARVQDLLADGVDEALIMPEARDLPEFMPEAEFVRRFGGVGAPAYERVVKDIEHRIDALEIHHGS